MFGWFCVFRTQKVGRNWKFRDFPSWNVTSHGTSRKRVCYSLGSFTGEVNLLKIVWKICNYPKKMLLRKSYAPFYRAQPKYFQHSISWVPGTSLFFSNRPTMIKYKIDDIRTLIGPKVNLQMVYDNPICLLDN